MNRETLYILKVALTDNKKIWRRIEMLSSQSLEVLHEVIFDAFDRVEPHLYSFYLTKPGDRAQNRFALAEEYTLPAMLEDGFVPVRKNLYDATQTKLGELPLKKGSAFEYVFDFGDDWRHVITVEDILDLFPKKKYPVITEKKGMSPPQYSDHDQDEDEDEDFSGYDDEESYEQSEKNQAVLEGFRQYLEARNLSDKTVRRHVTNIDFYINEYLLDEGGISPAEGIDQISYFLGYWFIRKGGWSSAASIKENITSLKHFYTFLAGQGVIGRDKLDAMKLEIKECKNDWFEAMRKYEDMDNDLDDIW